MRNWRGRETESVGAHVVGPGTSFFFIPETIFFLRMAINCELQIVKLDFYQRCVIEAIVCKLY